MWLYSRGGTPLASLQHLRLGAPRRARRIRCRRCARSRDGPPPTDPVMLRPAQARKSMCRSGARQEVAPLVALEVPRSIRDKPLIVACLLRESSYARTSRCASPPASPHRPGLRRRLGFIDLVHEQEPTSHRTQPGARVGPGDDQHSPIKLLHRTVFRCRASETQTLAPSSGRRLDHGSQACLIQRFAISTVGCTISIGPGARWIVSRPVVAALSLADLGAGHDDRAARVRRLKAQSMISRR